GYTLTPLRGWEPYSACFALQICLYEYFQVAVQNAVHVSNFDPRSEIFHHTVGLQYVRTDLAAPRDVQLAIFDGLRLGFLLLKLQFIEPGAKNLHAHIFVLVL